MKDSIRIRGVEVGEVVMAEEVIMNSFEVEVEVEADGHVIHVIEEGIVQGK